MKIKNPVLRFVFGLVVIALAAVALVFLFYGLGMLVESRWCAGSDSNLPCAYDHDGLTFWRAVSQGYSAVFILGFVGAVSWLVFRVARWVGNRFFGPRNSKE